MAGTPEAALAVVNGSGRAAGSSGARVDIRPGSFMSAAGKSYMSNPSAQSMSLKSVKSAKEQCSVMTIIIPFEKLEEGKKKSLENASRFLEDALFLFQNKRYQSSILLSMLSYEESGKAMMIMDYRDSKREITKTQWDKKFCSHPLKNLTSLRAIWQKAGINPHHPDQDLHTSRFQQDWKDVFTYVDYDFINFKWTSPISPETFFYRHSETSVGSFCTRAMAHAGEALKLAMEKEACLSP